MTRYEEVGSLARELRERQRLTQEQLAAKIGLGGNNRAAIAYFEQGKRLPDPAIVRQICTELGLPSALWNALASEEGRQRLEFEDAICELVGRPVALELHDEPASLAAERLISYFLGTDLTEPQALDTLNRILTFYGVLPMCRDFFQRYVRAERCRPIAVFRDAIRHYQADAIRLCSTFQDAYARMNRDGELAVLLKPLAPLPDDAVERYRSRTDWDSIEQIPGERLPDLGYISAARIREEQAERDVLTRFLRTLADALRQHGRTAIADIPESKRRKMSSLLRKFKSSLQHDLSSPLFAPDPDQLVREAESLAPTTEAQLERIAATQSTAQRNLAHYLTADHMDVYVATSMRVPADFVSVNEFVTQLFLRDEVRPLKLRYFNPTQSWISDRVAKGLVEALMLRRASLTIYMAQKEDTFGKDSEASVALGRGKPVLVYVPKLVVDGVIVDTEVFFAKPRDELLSLVRAEGGGSGDDELDDTVDEVALVGRLLMLRLQNASDEALASTVQRSWADFDLYGEASRIRDEALRGEYRSWLDSCRGRSAARALGTELRRELVGILVAVALGFERRAKIFREVHPLALQVILSSGVLNGILVVRSVGQCAALIGALIRNKLSLDLKIDDENYRLIEATTHSTVRVISRNRLLANAFRTYY